MSELLINYYFFSVLHRLGTQYTNLHLFNLQYYANSIKLDGDDDGGKMADL